MPTHPATQGERPGGHGTDSRKDPPQEYYTESEPMLRSLRNNLSLGHDNGQWAVFGAVCIWSGRESLAVQVQVPMRNPCQERLGSMVQLLARLHSHRGQITHPSVEIDCSNPQKMDMVSWPLKQQPTANWRQEVHRYLPASNHRRTRSTTTIAYIGGRYFSYLQERSTHIRCEIYKSTINRLNEGAPLAKGPLLPTDFWDFLNTWGGMWMWEGINENQPTKHKLTWLVEGMK